MNRFRFLFVLAALCTMAFAAVASAGSSIEPLSAGAYCNKLCIIGYHCIPSPTGGRCVPDHGHGAPASTVSEDSSETTPVSESSCVVDESESEDLASPPECGPCTILCPIGTRLIQTGNCTCKCVGNGG